MVEILGVEEIVKDFRSGKGGRKRHVRAVDGVSFRLHAGKTLGLVGESGCGKSTVANILLRLLDPSSGRIILEGKDVTEARGRELRSFRSSVQMVFQDPVSSLNPRKTVEETLRGSLELRQGLAADERNDALSEALRRVGLHDDDADRFPHEFSGGQRQRIGIARALAAHPKVMICDEPVSALDVSIQAQILLLLRELQNDLGISYLFISHDLSVVRQIADHVAVMYLGRIVEQGPTESLFERPAHPFTSALLSAVPVPVPSANRRRIHLIGEIPDASDVPTGCRFRTRCPLATKRCAVEEPSLDEHSDDRWVACHYAFESVQADLVSENDQPALENDRT